jgi:N-acyl homoserine lactone hydrolase
MVTSNIRQFSSENELLDSAHGSPTDGPENPMPNRKIYVISSLCLALSAAALAQGCVVSGHPAAEARWGSPARSSELEATLEQPGPIEVESIASATWHVPLEGMLNLDHPIAKAAGLQSSEQPVVIYFHALRHPTRGLYIVDTGVEHAMIQRMRPCAAGSPSWPRWIRFT